MEINYADIKRISGQLDAFYTAYKCYIYYREIADTDLNNNKSSGFWKFQEFLLLYALLINWCEVFGISNKNSHWKEMTLENKEFTGVLYSESGYSYNEWTSYRKYINEIKNSFIVFPDQYHHIQENYDLRGVEISLEITHKWLYDIVKDSKDMPELNNLMKWPLLDLKFMEQLRKDMQQLLHD